MGKDCIDLCSSCLFQPGLLVCVCEGIGPVNVHYLNMRKELDITSMLFFNE